MEKVSRERRVERRVSRRRFLSLAAGSGAVVALLAACGQAAPTPSPAAPTAAPKPPAQPTAAPVAQATAAPVPTAAPKPTTAPAAVVAPSGKQEITIVQGADAETLDPQAILTGSTLVISGAVCERLTKVDFPATGPALTPVLASSWKLLNDTTWQFKLREGVKFTNGEPFNADAVKYSMDRIMDSSNKWPTFKYVSRIAKVEPVDASTVNFVMKQPSPLLPLDMTRVWMVPPKYTNEVGKQGFANKPVGTGPFKFIEWMRDDHITVEANTDYWGVKPKLTKVIFKPIPEAATRTAAIRTGQADIVSPLPVADIPTLKQIDTIRVDTSPYSRVMYIVLDTFRHEALAKTKVRQALNYAVDKDAIVQQIFRGYGKKVGGQQISPEYFGYNHSLQAYPYDPAKAKQLLAEAGYPDGFSIQMKTTRGRYMLDLETAQAVAGMLEKVGVKVEILPQEWAVYVKELSEKKLSPMFLTAFATYPDADPMFDSFTKPGVYSYADIPAFDKAVFEARTTMDEKKRLALLQEAAKIQHDEALAIWLHQLMNIYAVNAKVQGFKINPEESFELHDVYLK